MEVHPLTDRPTLAWEQLSKVQKVIKIKTSPPAGNGVPDDKIRVVCMSDTHSLTSHVRFAVPDGDVFVHAGDFTKCGQLEEIVEFNEWLGGLPHKHKIVIAGNHELSFDENFTYPLSPRPLHEGDPGEGGHETETLGLPKDSIRRAAGLAHAKDRLTNCLYLQDSEAILYGVKFYGTPWQPEFQKWAFNLTRGKSCLQKWDLIPEDTDVLITHTPPVGHGDLCCTGVRAGCVELLLTVQKRVKPKYHVFGHIHEGYGITSDGKTIFVNASTCDIMYVPRNPPIVFDIALPPGVRK